MARSQNISPDIGEVIRPYATRTAAPISIIDDFDVIFAFPWPAEEEMYCDLFARFAASGALLVTYSALDDVRVYRNARAFPAGR